LLIANLSYTGSMLEEAKVGVLTAAIIAAGLSAALFRVVDWLPGRLAATRRATDSLPLMELVRFVARQLPLPDVHPNAALAAEAAGAQGRFWEMHDLLYQREHALGFSDLVSYAAELQRLD
jgi:hypothetical protein